MKNDKPSSVDEYIVKFPKGVQEILHQVRTVIKETVPQADESISYAMPAYKLNGKPLVYFAGYENHIGFYATPTGHAAFAKELSKYKQGKGSVQFPLSESMPLKLIQKIVEFRAEGNVKKIKPQKQIGFIRKYALSLSDTTEESHFEKTSFRVNKKIFATYDEKQNRLCVKFSQIDQNVFSTIDRTLIYTVPNKWGKQGWTFIELDKLSNDILKDALNTAYNEVAPRKKEKTNIQKDIVAYHKTLSKLDKDICDLLYKEISKGLPEAENKVWHAHPVWFLDGNPIVGYSKQKAGIHLMFWSGADFDEDGLDARGAKFKDASVFYNAVDEINTKELKRWLKKSKAIQWDYKNIVKRKGVLVKLK